MQEVIVNALLFTLYIFIVIAAYNLGKTRVTVNIWKAMSSISDQFGQELDGEIEKQQEARQLLLDFESGKEITKEQKNQVSESFKSVAMVTGKLSMMKEICEKFKKEL